MAEDLTKLKEIIRSNIRNIKEVADALVYVREKLLATQETVDELMTRVEGLELKRSGVNIDGVPVFNVGNGENSQVANRTPDLDAEEAEIGTLIAQHPKWLRPFSVQAELEKHDLEVETLRLRRSTTGYLRVIRLTNGSEWAYFENMSYDRYTRMPLLKDVFDLSSSGKDTESRWSSALIEKPVRLQALQRGARWEILGKGLIVCES